MRRVGMKVAALILASTCIAVAFSMIVPLAGAQSASSPPVTNASITGTVVSNNWYNTNVTVNLTASGGNGGISRTLYSLDGASYVNYTSNIILSDGSHKLLFYSIDNAGNSEVINLSHNQVFINVDTKAPIMNIAVRGQLNGSVYNGIAYVNFSAYDTGSGIWGLSYRIDQGQWVNNVANITNISIGDGSHTLDYMSYDNASNTNSSSMTITVRNPVVQYLVNGNLIATKDSYAYYNTTVNPVDISFSPAAGTNAGEIKYIQYSNDTKNWINIQLSQHLTYTAEGKYNLYYRVVDTSDTVYGINYILFGIDNTPPTIGISPSGDWDAKNCRFNNDITITINANSNCSISHTEYSYDQNNWNNYGGPFVMKWGASRSIWYRTTDMAGNTASGNQFIVFRPQGVNYDQMTGGSYVQATPTLAPTTGSSPGNTNPAPSKITAPATKPSPQPSPTPAAQNKPTGSSSPLAIAVLVAVLAVIAIAAAAYFFLFKPK